MSSVVQDRQTDRQTARQDYHANTMLCSAL